MYAIKILLRKMRVRYFQLDIDYNTVKELL
jgi:hypothetical protein